MGSSKSTAQFLKKIHQMETATERQRVAAVTEAAAAAKKVMLATAAAGGVSPGGKIAKRPWGVSYTVRSNGREATAIVKFTGPFHLVNNPTLPHYIAAGGLGGSRRNRSDIAFRASAARFMDQSTRGVFGGQRKSRGKRAISLGPDRLFAYVHHPGTKGKHIFQTAKPLVITTGTQVMARSMSSTWKKVMA